jgi:hypothetical protein
MRLQHLAGSAAALGLLVCPANASAQAGIAARASTLGAGVELSYRPGKLLGFRIAGNFLEFSRDATIDNIDYHLTPHLENGTAIIDLYPMGGSFHLSGGLLLNRNEGRFVARLNRSVLIGDRTYAPEEIGSLRGTVNFQKSAPYLGLGLGGRGRIAVLFDLGVGITGTPRVDLVGETPLTGAAKAEFDANVARELSDVRTEIDGKSYLKFHPVLSLGLRFGF